MRQAPLPRPDDHVGCSNAGMDSRVTQPMAEVGVPGIGGQSAEEILVTLGRMTMPHRWYLGAPFEGRHDSVIHSPVCVV